LVAIRPLPFTDCAELVSITFGRTAAASAPSSLAADSQACVYVPRDFVTQFPYETLSANDSIIPE
jgi:hypothetical protein